MNSGADVAENLATADGLVREAATDGCGLVVLPENFALMPVKGRDKAAHAETPGEGPIQSFLADAAKANGVWIVAGSMPMQSPDPERVYGACPVYDAEGTQRGCYRKIHLFDVKVPGSGESYQESWSMYPGEEIVTVDSPVGTIGLTICYDVRFPELFRRLLDKGATVFTVPSAFTRPTGNAHWHTLLRARAIENLAYVIAPGQSGEHPHSRTTFGHSVIVDPWGSIIAEAPDEVCFVAADIDPAKPARLRKEFPALLNRSL